jgi:hypothetical protein
VAQVDRSTSSDVDHLLKRALATWESLPDVEREIDTWDLADQIAFVEEWPLEEERLQRLAQSERAGALDDRQRAEYARLLTVVARNRSVVARLLSA